MYTDLGRPGDTFAVARDRAIGFVFVYTAPRVINVQTAIDCVFVFVYSAPRVINVQMAIDCLFVFVLQHLA